MAHEFTDINSDFKNKSFEKKSIMKYVQIDLSCVIKNLKLEILLYKLLL